MLQSQPSSLWFILIIGIGILIVYYFVQKRVDKIGEKHIEIFKKELHNFFEILGLFDYFIKEKEFDKKLKLFNKLRVELFKYQNKYPHNKYKKDIIRIEKELVKFMEENNIEPEEIIIKDEEVENINTNTKDNVKKNKNNN